MANPQNHISSKIYTHPKTSNRKGTQQIGFSTTRYSTLNLQRSSHSSPSYLPHQTQWSYIPNPISRRILLQHHNTPVTALGIINLTQKATHMKFPNSPAIGNYRSKWSTYSQSCLHKTHWFTINIPCFMR